MTPGSVVVGYLDDGGWRACFGLSYRDLIMHDLLNSARIVRKDGKELRQVCGTGGIVAGRNQVTKDFLDNTDGEYLFFVDTDMGFAADTVDRLVKVCDRISSPVVGGLCFKLSRKRNRGDYYAERYSIAPTIYEYLELEDEVGFRPMADYPRDSMTKCAGTGAACIIIHRQALTKLRKAYGDVWFDPITHPLGYKGKPRTFSEDLSFCVRCHAQDLPVYVHTGIKTCHDKHGVFLDEAAYDAQQAAREPVGA